MMGTFKNYMEIWFGRIRKWEIQFKILFWSLELLESEKREERRSLVLFSLRLGVWSLETLKVKYLHVHIILCKRKSRRSRVEDRKEKFFLLFLGSVVAFVSFEFSRWNFLRAGRHIIAGEKSTRDCNRESPWGEWVLELWVQIVGFKSWGNFVLKLGIFRIRKKRREKFSFV